MSNGSAENRITASTPAASPRAGIGASAAEHSGNRPGSSSRPASSTARIRSADSDVADDRPGRSASCRKPGRVHGGSVLAQSRQNSAGSSRAATAVAATRVSSPRSSGDTSTTSPTTLTTRSAIRMAVPAGSSAASASAAPTSDADSARRPARSVARSAERCAVNSSTKWTTPATPPGPRTGWKPQRNERGLPAPAGRHRQVHVDDRLPGREHMIQRVAHQGSDRGSHLRQGAPQMRLDRNPADLGETLR